jgi:hypothetical protein
MEGKRKYRKENVLQKFTVPMETPQSMLEDPSRGSNTTQYLPLLDFSTKIASSFSSDTRTFWDHAIKRHIRNL